MPLMRKWNPYQKWYCFSFWNSFEIFPHHENGHLMFFSTKNGKTEKN